MNNARENYNKCISYLVGVSNNAELLVHECRNVVKVYDIRTGGRPLPSYVYGNCYKRHHRHGHMRRGFKRKCSSGKIAVVAPSYVSPTVIHNGDDILPELHIRFSDSTGKIRVYDGNGRRFGTTMCILELDAENEISGEEFLELLENECFGYVYSETVG